MISHNNKKKSHKNILKTEFKNSQSLNVIKKNNNKVVIIEIQVTM